MMNYLISKFIDDELSFDDKILFVEKVHKDEAFGDESIELLQQEKLIRSEVVDRIPAFNFKIKRKLFASVFRTLGLLVPAVAAATIILFLVKPAPKDSFISHRFVIYRPDVTKAEIAGSFTDWKRIPMRRIGYSGYWDITINLSKGEHRFTFILDDKQKFADPTVPSREHDDFGGENSIISVESKT